MRKYLWFAAILMVAAAAAVYGTARYATEFPTSFVAGCLSGVRVAMSLEPHTPPAQAEDGPAAAEIVCHVDKPVPQARLPRDHAPDAEPPQDPPEVIRIEQIDPRVAEAIAEGLNVPPQILQKIEQTQSTKDKGPDEVSLTILDWDGPIELTFPVRSDAESQEPPCRTDDGYRTDRPSRIGGHRHHDTQTQVPACPMGGCRYHGYMPYCDDVRPAQPGTTDTDGNPPQCRPFFGGAEGSNASAVSPVRERNDLVMPYVEEENTNAPEGQESEANESSDVQEQDAATPEGTTESECPATHEAPAYHHEEHEGCPYLNGRYCPRTSQPYCPVSPAQPEDMKQPETRSDNVDQDMAQPATEEGGFTWFERLFVPMPPVTPDDFLPQWDVEGFWFVGHVGS
jgi:hypothetical protein